MCNKAVRFLNLTFNYFELLKRERDFQNLILIHSIQFNTLRKYI